MKQLIISISVILGLTGGVAFSVGQDASNFWGLGIYNNIDDLIGRDAAGNRTYDPNTGYSTNCTIDPETGTRSAGCGYNPSGKRDAMQFNYESGGGVLNQVGFFSDGRIAIDSLAPSDGESCTGCTGQYLEFDVEGAVGAQYYCNAEGENCYTSSDLRRGLDVIASNSAWPVSPDNKAMVFNRAGRTLQIYDDSAHGGGGGWQPTYTKFMAYSAVQIGSLSPAPEVGDQLTNTDCDIALVYNGSAWIDMANNERNISTCAIVAP